MEAPEERDRHAWHEAAVDQRNDQRRRQRDLQEVRLLGEAPLAPATQPKLRQRHAGAEAHGEERCGEQERNADRRRRRRESDERQGPEPRPEDELEGDEDEEEPPAGGVTVARFRLRFEQKRVAAQVSRKPAGQH